MTARKAFFVYLARCSDGSYYCGWTTDLARRMRAHNAGRAGARYTRSRRPVELAYSERHFSRSKAMRREAEIKRLTRAEKLRLVGRKIQDGSWDRGAGLHHHLVPFLKR